MKNFRSLRDELLEAPDSRELKLVHDDPQNETSDNRQAQREFLKKHVVHFMRHPAGNEHVFSGSRDPVGPNLPDVVSEDLKEAKEKDEYQKFFEKALKKFKIDSPADLKSDEAKKKFFDYVDKNWKGKDEPIEPDKVPGQKSAKPKAPNTMEEREITEDVYNTLLDIVKRRQRKSVKFDNRKTLDVDTTTAGALIKVHDALKPQNQKKYKENLSKGPQAFLKMVDFAFDNVS